MDNASVELKSLMMASNVPLRKIREAIVAAIVERIEVETVEVLQVRLSPSLTFTLWTWRIQERYELY